MKAAAIAGGDGRKAFNEALDAIEQYVKRNEKQMAKSRRRAPGTRPSRRCC